MGNPNRGSMMIEGRIARFCVYLAMYRAHRDSAAWIL